METAEGLLNRILEHVEAEYAESGVDVDSAAVAEIIEADRHATRLAAKLEVLSELKRLIETSKWLDLANRKESGWGRAYQAAMRQMEEKYRAGGG